MTITPITESAAIPPASNPDSAPPAARPLHITPARADMERVVCATPGDIPAVAALAAAHAEGKLWVRKLLPPEARARILPQLAVILAEHALQHGHIDRIGERAVAIWLDRTIALPPPEQLDVRLNEACGTGAALLRRALTATAEIHRQCGPHLYVAVLAADLHDCQALLAHRHRRLDRAAVTACADVGTAKEMSMLAVAGYRPGQPYRLPGGPPRWPMRRQPNAEQLRPRFWPPNVG